jgi:hypothetical protein
VLNFMFSESKLPSPGFSRGECGHQLCEIVASAQGIRITPRRLYAVDKIFMYLENSFLKLWEVFGATVLWCMWKGTKVTLKTD